MSISTTHRTAGQAGVDERRRVEVAAPSGEMEGLHVTPASRTDAEDYVAGRISVRELRARVRARHGGVR
ncbi:antitoxin VbhA family protein [Curtobacterium flaccumfaciens]|uniref:antitoxin VbhA family protein n=1 Tax=Curtobacterium flaccumfaciens TaxID=2035 RepID=UPI001BDE0EC2|nr:antitoxin VbhA family protein [Curtobacterium flaccumfaciens]MBT1608612.1 antitoxin VbhA family protein [Curtobacterium flaccumfaciens pv. betae]MBT1658497.1 antitoxin VbhA family protein [Curtobacterium flaccumfaciens pv. betae]MCS0472873.1 hypothetical protein [Curtobacterium flaccumfaciens pv. betae]MCS0476275.1 hypothetical protein [Curtobacterium flaccumfaciens pv. betae]MCS0479727.1 hypothetical protein [Curtobacterium flaccumfaciens pv. betae]